MARLLVGQVVHDGVTELDEFCRCDRMQVGDRQRVTDSFAAPLQLDLDLPVDIIVQHGGERHELRDQFAVDAQQDVAGLELAISRRVGNDLFDYQHPGLVGERRTHQSFRFLRQPESGELVVCLALEHRLQGATRNRLALLD